MAIREGYQIDTLPVQMYGYDGQTIVPLIATMDGALIAVSALTPSKYDAIDLGYTLGDLTTISYYLASVLVSTLNLTYNNGELTRIEKA